MSATISTDKFAAYLGNALAPPSSLPSSPPPFSSDVSRGNPHSASHSHFTESEYGIQSTQSSKYPTHAYPKPTSISNLTAAPVMFIPGFTYPVTEYYKNDFEDPLRGNVDLNAWRNLDPGSMEGVQTDPLGARIGGQKRAGDIDYDLLVRLIIKLSIGENGKFKNYGKEKGSNKNSDGGDRDWDDVTVGGKEESLKGNRADMFVRAEGSILIFLPGVPEINKTIRLLESVWGDMELPPSSPKLKIIPL